MKTVFIIVIAAINIFFFLLFSINAHNARLRIDNIKSGVANKILVDDSKRFLQTLVAVCIFAITVIAVDAFALITLLMASRF